jgi:hypothetical protein
LKEKLHDAHNAVREHIRGEIYRQKRYHDAKLNCDKFGKGDKVYVFFPTRKIGNSSKLTSYWRDPFEILCQISDLLYKVNCGGRGKPQVVHVDRLRLQKSQVLCGETEQEDDEVDTDKVDETKSDRLENTNADYTVRGDVSRLYFVVCLYIKSAWLHLALCLTKYNVLCAMAKKKKEKKKKKKKSKLPHL